jgi:glycosyltransferase involved in cell wall biosynthesis
MVRTQNIQRIYKNMTISLIIPAYNEEKYLGACLESVAKNRTSDIIEVIVVNNASTDGTRAVAEKFPGVRVVDEPSKGLTKARQRGFMEAKGDLVAYIDADTQMPPGWADKAEKEFAHDSTMVCLSGPFHYYDLPPLQKFLAETMWSISAPITYWITGFMVLGANFIAKHDALTKIGGFDTSIAFYGEDTNLALRLSKVGKAKFNMRFFILGSGRRLIDEGLVKTFWRYAVNYYTVAFHQKPHTAEYKDIR